MKEQRLKDIENYLQEKQMCHLDELCEVFGVSKITIRRDIETLCSQNIATKVYGGIKFNKQVVAPLIPYLQRKSKNDLAKEKIGELAAKLVENSNTIFLDSGTSTPKILKYLEEKTINILTANLTIINDSLAYPNIKLLSTGGELNPMTKSFVGEKVIESIESFNTSIAFMAATGFSIKNGFTNSTTNETSIKKSAIQNSAKTYVLLDSSKWNIVSLTSFAKSQEITGIISDAKPPAEIEKHLKKMNVEFLY